MKLFISSFIDFWLSILIRQHKVKGYQQKCNYLNLLGHTNYLLLKNNTEIQKREGNSNNTATRC